MDGFIHQPINPLASIGTRNVGNHLLPYNLTSFAIQLRTAWFLCKK